MADPIRTYLSTLRAGAAGRSPVEVVASAASQLADRDGHDGWSSLPLAAHETEWVAARPPPGAGPEWLGPVFEGLHAPGERRSRGVHFTPPRVAAGLVAQALPNDLDGATLLDPSVGGGAFLLAAAELLAERGIDPFEIVTERVFGADIDPHAAAVSDAALTMWAGRRGVEASPGDHLVVTDALRAASLFDRRFSCVVGNPPFQSQLASTTARSRAAASAVRRRFGAAASGYVDNAALFMLLGLEHCAPGGRVVMIQPASMLATDGAAGVRRRVTELGSLVGMWNEDGVFQASVEVCAPIIELVDTQPDMIELFAGTEVVASGHAPFPGGDSTWSGLALPEPAPAVELYPEPTLGDIATTTAGFRDQYYGLADHVVDAADRTELPELVSVGLIEPLGCEWGRREMRFAKQRWRHPRVDVDGLRADDEKLWSWVDARLKPKVLVATQTKVIEAAVDVDGRWVPSTPVISVEPDPDDLWLVAAMLTAPPLSALAYRAFRGAALSRDTLKLSARQLAALPRPLDVDAWHEGAELARLVAAAPDRRAGHEALLAMGRAMTDAYGASDDVYDWWRERLRSPTLTE